MSGKRKESATSLWIAVGVLFALMAIGWMILFRLVAENPVESVPLEHRQNP